MRYPVGQLGTKDEFDKFWYDAQGFGVKTDYGYHEGCDFNLKTGGDSDLGQLLYAVGDGKIVYYHDNSHPTTGFGKHMVLYCQTPLGDRWYHYAHCKEITATVKEVKRGDVIGKLGKTGTQYAHLHFAVFKVDPKTLRSGIDTIAKTITELNSWWEDPFVTLNMEEKPKDLPDWFKTLLQERGLSLDREGEFRDFWEKAIKYDKDITDLREQIKRLNEIVGPKFTEVSMLTEKVEKLEGEKEDLRKALNEANKAKDEFEYQLRLANITLERIQKDLEKAQAAILAKDDEIKRLKDDNIAVLDKIPPLKLITRSFVRIFLRR
jgi:hypothetical protein